MKKILSIAIMVVMIITAFALGGCGSQKSTGASDKDASNQVVASNQNTATNQVTTGAEPVSNAGTVGATSAAKDTTTSSTMPVVNDILVGRADPVLAVAANTSDDALAVSKTLAATDTKVITKANTNTKAVATFVPKVDSKGFNIYTGGDLAKYGTKPLHIASYAALAELVTKELSVDSPIYTLSDAGKNATTNTTNSVTAEDASSAEVGGNSYSATNTQVNGVDESDIIKTDGKYIYLSGQKGVYILNKDLSQAAFIEKPADTYINDMYVSENRLVVLGNEYEGSSAQPSNGKVGIESDLMMPIGTEYTSAMVYDTTDMKNISLIQNYKIEGYLNESRVVNDVLYLVSNKYVYNVSGDDGKGMVPMYSNKATGYVATPMPIDKIMCLPYVDSDNNSFCTLSAVDIKDSSKAVSMESIIGGNDNIYMTNDKLFLVGSKYNYDNDNWSVDTIINSFDVDGMNITYHATGQVSGSVLNQFSMNEHNNYFEIATTENKNNSVFMLDDTLKQVGAVKNIAEGEQIYAVRFTGNTAYVVTYKTIDPLFVIDLTDPTNPTVVGELSIPGFSNYLHPIADGYLLGIGQDTTQIYKKDRNGKEVVIGTQQEGLKLSLFDVTDPKNPKEVDSYAIGENGSYADVLYNHKALMVDASSDIFAFNASLAYGSSYDYKNTGLIFKVDTKGIKLITQLTPKSTDNCNYNVNANGRLCYIGDTIYYIQNDTITSYDMANYKEISSKSF